MSLGCLEKKSQQLLYHQFVGLYNHFSIDFPEYESFPEVVLPICENRFFHSDAVNGFFKYSMIFISISIFLDTLMLPVIFGNDCCGKSLS